MSTKVVLVCANGFTTTMLRNKVDAEAKEFGLDLDVKAYPMTEIDVVAEDADVLLLGPQIRFKLNEMKKKYPQKHILLVDSQAVAFVDGKKVLKQIRDELNI